MQRRPFSHFGSSDFEAGVAARPREQAVGGTERGGVAGKATLRGYTGHVEGEGTFNGNGLK